VTPRAGLDTDAVVATAAGLADAHGLDAVSLTRLARELGVRPPSLYAHVAGLPDLRARLAARGAAELADALRSAAAGRARGDALHAVAAAYRRYALAHPGTYQALQRAPDLEGGQAGAALVDVVLAVLRGYGLRGHRAIHGARAVRAALHGFVLLETREGFGLPLTVEESYRRLVAILDRGLSAA